jgi:hypothetical protein
VGGQIVSVLPMSFRIEEWKTDPCVICFVYRRIAEKRWKRRWAIHPINSGRFVDGAFRNLYGTLTDDRDTFFNYFRMLVASFDELVVKFQGTIQARQGLSLSLQEMLAITLR